MRDTMGVLRLAVYNALAGQVQYESTEVPVFDEKLIPGTSFNNIYIILSTQQETEAPQQTSEAFSSESSIDIEVHHATEFEVTKNAIDEVSNRILEILVPNTFTSGLSAPLNIQFVNVRRSRAVSRNFSITSSSTVVAKIITITCVIVQQNP